MFDLNVKAYSLEDGELYEMLGFLRASISRLSYSPAIAIVEGYKEALEAATVQVREELKARNLPTLEEIELENM